MMHGLSGSTLDLDGAGVFTALATPAVLLVVNAMLILSTVQRLQAILARIRENEKSLRRDGSDVADRHSREGIRVELDLHARRVRLAHRALLAFYLSAGMRGGEGEATRSEGEPCVLSLDRMMFELSELSWPERPTSLPSTC